MKDNKYPDSWKKKLYFSLPIVIDYIGAFQRFCRRKKGSFEILNGKEVAEDCTRYLKILKDVQKEIGQELNKNSKS